MIEEEHLIREELVNHFAKIFTSAHPTEFELILQGIEQKVTPSMSSDLTREFTADEVEQALKQMKPLLALGLDGFSPIFYKSFWNFIRQDVIAATLSVLNTGNMPKNLSHTFISLISRTKAPEKAKDFRPISLLMSYTKLCQKTLQTD